MRFIFFILFASSSVDGSPNVIRPSNGYVLTDSSEGPIMKRVSCVGQCMKEHCPDEYDDMGLDQYLGDMGPDGMGSDGMMKARDGMPSKIIQFQNNPNNMHPLEYMGSGTPYKDFRDKDFRYMGDGAMVDRGSPCFKKCNHQCEQVL